MAADNASRFIQHVRRAVLTDDAGLTDWQLLDRFVTHLDDAALAAIVRRHAAMVWGVCRRLLDRHDAEDAFQATFLVLVRRAASVAPREMVGNWLYGVARRTAVHARRTVIRRRARERWVPDVPEPLARADGPWDDLRPVLDEELSRLPDRYRAVVVLCDLEGLTRAEAARRLGAPEGTVAGRLARARAMLAKRLTRRGIGLSAAAAGLLPEPVASAGLPVSLVQAAISTATLHVGGRAGVIPVGVASLAEGVVNAMLLSKLKAATVVVLLGLGLVVPGVGVTQHTAARQPQPARSGRSAASTEGPAAASSEGADGLGYVGPGRGGSEEYRALFRKALGVVAEHFEEITSANQYDGRIEARQPVGRKRAVIEIRAADGGRFAVLVRVYRVTAGEPESKPAARDADLERVILNRLNATAGKNPAVSPPHRGIDSSATEGVGKRNLMQEVDDLRERVKALERMLADVEKGKKDR